MIIIDIEIYSFRDKEYIIHEALVDTGAGFCAVTKHLSEALDLPLMGGKIHLWQARDPLELEKTQLRLRYNDNVYDTVGVIIDIPPEYRRSIKAGEECTRPKYRHPLRGLFWVKIFSECFPKMKEKIFYDLEGNYAEKEKKLDYHFTFVCVPYLFSAQCK